MAAENSGGIHLNQHLLFPSQQCLGQGVAAGLQWENWGQGSTLLGWHLSVPSASPGISWHLVLSTSLAHLGSLESWAKWKTSLS